jgi:AmmeMemoRadiSam system protein A
MEEQIKQMLIQIARGAIYSELFGENIIDKNDLVEKVPNLTKRAATFVTLNIDGNLRGCIGSLIAHRALIDDLTSNAYAAAFKDPRFPPLTKEEFEKLELEVSLLSDALEVRYKDLNDLKSKINIGVDGMIIRQENKQATFLPQVWEQLPNFEDFLSHLFAKAGINDLEKPVEVFVYQVEKIKE